MPKVHPSRRRHHSGAATRTVVERGGYRTAPPHEVGRPCVASNHCPNPIVPDAPFPVCGKHLREAYSFAADMVTDQWDDAVREYVSTLHGTFEPPRAVKQPRSGWLYFIRFGDRVKVGYTTRPDNRLKSLPHEQVIGILPGTRADERAWHTLLAEFHVVGEWFRADPAVLAALEKVAQQSA